MQRETIPLKHFAKRRLMAKKCETKQDFIVLLLERKKVHLNNVFVKAKLSVYILRKLVNAIMLVVMSTVTKFVILMNPNPGTPWSPFQWKCSVTLKLRDA